MASITIRNLDDSLKGALRSRAAAHGRSMEEEARQLLKQALLRDRSAKGLGTAIANLFKESDGVELDLPMRSQPRVPPSFGESEST